MLYLIFGTEYNITNVWDGIFLIPLFLKLDIHLLAQLLRLVILTTLRSLSLRPPKFTIGPFPIRQRFRCFDSARGGQELQWCPSISAPDKPINRDKGERARDGGVLGEIRLEFCGIISDFDRCMNEEIPLIAASMLGGSSEEIRLTNYGNYETWHTGCDMLWLIYLDQSKYERIFDVHILYANMRSFIIPVVGRPYPFVTTLYKYIECPSFNLVNYRNGCGR